MTLYALKPRFQALLRPLVGRLAAAGVTANQVTVAAMLGSIAVGAAVAAFGRETPAVFLLVPVWLAARMALNAVDGMLAREHGQKSDLGAFLNEIGDVVSDAALYAPFALVPAFGGFAVAVVVLLAVLTEFAGVAAAAIGAPRRYDGPMGKSDRAFVFGAVGLWVGFGLPLPPWTWPLPWLIAILLLATVVRRVAAALAAKAVP